MTPETYVDKFRVAYEGEIVAERLYRSFAAKSANAWHARACSMIAAVEAATHGKLRPLALRLGVEPDEAELQRRVLQRADQLSRISWAELIGNAVKVWPSYTLEFETLAAAAQPGDEASLQFLVEHEVALVEFARLEHARSGMPDNLAPLVSLLQRANTQSATA